MNISTITESLDTYKLLEDDASKPVFDLLADVAKCYTDGKLDIEGIVNAISERKTKELQAIVQQAEKIVAQAQKLSATMAEE